MTSWVIIAIVAYFLYAGESVANKFQLTKSIRKPIAYAFYVCIIAPLAFILAPFGLQILSAPLMAAALISGVLFACALIYYYMAMQQTSVSRILPIEGGFVPLFTFILAYFFLGERLQSHQVLAVAFLISGGVLMAFKREKVGWTSKALTNAIIAALLFSLSFIFMKYVYLNANFISGLLWPRLGSFLAALAFLLWPKARRDILNTSKKTTRSNKILFYTSQSAGALAGFLQNFAISLGSVSVINALQGTQFVFLLALTTLFSYKFPKILKEEVTQKILLQKILAIMMVTLGLVLLSI